MNQEPNTEAEETVQIGSSQAVAQERLVRKSSYVVMKVIQGWHEHWDVHCVCEDRKTAKAECDLQTQKQYRTDTSSRAFPSLRTYKVTDRPTLNR